LQKSKRSRIDFVNGSARIPTDIATYAAANHAVVRVLSKDGHIIAQTNGAPNFGIAGVGPAAVFDWRGVVVVV